MMATRAQFGAHGQEWVQIPSDSTHNNDYGVNDLGQLVFRIGFQDGTYGIFRATVIPEPAGSIFATASLFFLLGSRSRRQRFAGLGGAS